MCVTEAHMQHLTGKKAKENNSKDQMLNLSVAKVKKKRSHVFMTVVHVVIGEQLHFRLLMELEDTVRKLRDTSREVEELKAEVSDARDLAQQNEKKRDEIKIKAQETVKQ